MSTRQTSDAPAAAQGTVARTVRLIQCIAQTDDAVSVGQLTAQMDLPSSTVHRLLQLLKRDGIVESDPVARTYRVGPELHRLAALIVARSSTASLALPIMERVVAACGETCLLAVYDPDTRKTMFVEQVQSHHPLRFEVAGNVPLPPTWGSSGRVILAELPDDELQAVLADPQPSPVGGQQLGDPAEFAKELRKVRARGHDLTRGELLADSVGIAAPVFQRGRGVIGSLTIAIPSVRYQPAQRASLIQLVGDAADELSRLLGHERSA
ncbi:IclR family transcriptional regulator [Conexibacter woesei]|uniref:Transcriptional regulator, IclR family n=1 Tax=Conexibacter woesei (strain DSM 14684 / CCUG 47730 / CIP 108061 / JCM 11494 / NBRC 100937 / ID131577) TaxID=469383 RepID=D3F3M6_CONWI|nr:IclR family transcriptional regulator [Conexibacter woesei]ADB52391.1 transcriptional regulator, IclR family [Conexibacter woesei DSM 14684]